MFLIVISVIFFLIMEVEFNKAVEFVKTQPPTTTASDQDKLKVYALFKQATVGDCNTEKPSFFSIKESEKWKAWNALKGMSETEAKKQYIEFVYK